MLEKIDRQADKQQIIAIGEKIAEYKNQQF